MGIQFNIKSEEARELAEDIAAITGENLTKVVVEALKARKHALTKQERFDRVMAMVEANRDLWTPEERSVDHGELLYDEKGMPR